MALDTLSDTLYHAPSAAEWATLTCSTTHWGDSAPVELTSGVDADSILVGISVRCIGANSDVTPFEIDIRTGDDGSPTVIATFPGYAHNLADDRTGDDGNQIPTIIGIDAIADGDRLSAVFRKGGIVADTYAVQAHYLKKPLTGTLLTTTNPLLVSPSAANNLTLATTSATPWTAGAWTEWRGASGAAIVVVLLESPTPNNSVADREYDIGTGGAGSEAVVTTTREAFGSITGMPWIQDFPYPLDNIAASTRVALRARADRASQTFSIKIGYFEKPL